MESSLQGGVCRGWGFKMGRSAVTLVKDLALTHPSSLITRLELDKKRFISAERTAGHKVVGLLWMQPQTCLKSQLQAKMSCSPENSPYWKTSPADVLELSAQAKTTSGVFSNMTKGLRIQATSASDHATLYPCSRTFFRIKGWLATTLVWAAVPFSANCETCIEQNRNYLCAENIDVSVQPVNTSSQSYSGMEEWKGHALQHPSCLYEEIWNTLAWHSCQVSNQKLCFADTDILISSTLIFHASWLGYLNSSMKCRSELHLQASYLLLRKIDFTSSQNWSPGSTEWTALLCNQMILFHQLPWEGRCDSIEHRKTSFYYVRRTRLVAYCVAQAVWDERGVIWKPVLQECGCWLVFRNHKEALDVQLIHMLDPINDQVWVSTSAGGYEDGIVFSDFLQLLWWRPKLDDSTILKIILRSSASKISIIYT